MKQIIQTDQAPAPVGAYSQAVQFNGMLFLSGSIAIHPDTGELVLDDIQSETHQVMRNIEAVLREAGSGFDKVLKCSVFVSDILNFAAINEVYASYFDAATAPARELVEVAALPKGVNVEISVIAAA